ncbi:MAG: helix-turn-helix transcriptional regulator [Muribaculaceae bacterium]|nr:helix-turn-helix transcriptional regulator [Muribaculaceae bacterium]
MDFVNRLKQFLELKQIPITQFADNCRIPRPTLSQLLNGRNKKVSDEVIGKIHDAYPNLSVMWLMFGEGNMLTDDQTQSSGSGSTTRNDSMASFKTQSLENALFDDMFNDEQNGDSIDTAKGDSPTTIRFPQATDTAKSKNDSPAKSTVSAIKNKVTSTGDKKRIVNIIVYYDDNSFEAFVPGDRK